MEPRLPPNSFIKCFIFGGTLPDLNASVQILICRWKIGYERGVDAAGQLNENHWQRTPGFTIKVEELKAERNTVSAEIAQAKRNKENADNKIAAMQNFLAEVKN